MAEALNSTDELNIDSFFSEQSGSKDAVASKDDGESPEEAPDEKPDKKSKKQSDEDLDEDALDDEDDSKGDNDDDSEDDDDLEDDDLDDDEDLDAGKKKKNVSKELGALSKQAKNAELQRKQMQSERDTYKAQFEKANSNIESLTKQVEKLTQLTANLTKKAEQSETFDFLTGDKDALVTEEQFRKAFEKLTKSPKKSDSQHEGEGDTVEEKVRRILAEQSKKADKTDSESQPKVGSDEEARKFWEDVQNQQKAWVDQQPGAIEIGQYYVDNKDALDPELAPIPSIDAKFIAIRERKKEIELKKAKKALKKAKARIARMEKGELPETASGNRRNASDTKRTEPEDRLVAFFNK